MKPLFWLFAFLSIYSYAIYPLIVFVWSKVVRNLWTRLDITPDVSIVISAYNEEAVIVEKITNALALDYPSEKVEIIVSSDGSTDRTHDLVRAIDDPRVKLHAFPRIGKTACLNRVVPEARGEIVLFTDANAMFPADTLRRLVRNFSDERIGLVTGGTRYFTPDGAREVTGMYARLERWTKWHESLAASCVGADGAIFAVRRHLFVPLQGNDINDFIIPLNVIGQGRRVVLDPEVNCREPASGDEKKAFRRQVRITNRTTWAIVRHLRFTNPRRYGAFAFFLISHKLLRFGIPFFFLLTGLINMKLVSAGPVYIVTLLAYAAFVASGLLSYWKKTENKVAAICKFFLVTIVAQMIGVLRMLVGIEDKIWTPER
jgi:cellulose synthase/poly-beta-1,6-N-acetylglucosamine synthase-like glycosyltransferase